MNKLEIYDQFKKRFGVQLNPALYSVKYCQSETKALIELYFSIEPKLTIINFDFMGGEIMVDEDDNDKDILP